jgi:hypothetical protein
MLGWTAFERSFGARTGEDGRTMWRRLIAKLACLRETTDDLFVAAALAESGERDLALEALREGRERRSGTCRGLLHRADERPVSRRRTA